MRIAAVLVMLAACYGHDESPPPPAVRSVRLAAARMPVPELSCPQSAVSGLRDADPSKGGYRLVTSAPQLQPVRAAMKAGTPVHSRERTRSIAAALADFRPELQACLVAADGSHPASQYELRVMITGNSVASLVEHVSLQRIVAVNPDHSPVFTSTVAQACTDELLRRLVLPPGDTMWEFSVTVRQDFCTPTAVIALQATHSYVDATTAASRVRRVSMSSRSTA
jgi:hypothetical protein